MLFKYMDKYPELAESVFIADTANLVGACKISANASVWYGAVLRADIAPIVVGEGTNIQDGAVCHVDYDKPVLLGKNVTIGHGVILHACTVKDNSLIGMGAIVLDGAIVEEGALVGAGAVVTPGTIVESGSLYLGNPAKFKRKLTDGELEYIKNNAKVYVELARNSIKS